jgi:hypothetical protein
MHEISLLVQELLGSQEGAWCREFLSFLILVVAYSMKFKNKYFEVMVQDKTKKEMVSVLAVVLMFQVNVTSMLRLWQCANINHVPRKKSLQLKARSEC